MFDRDFNRTGMITNYISVKWQEDYYGRGEFMMVCVDSPENIRLLRQNNFLVRSDKKTAMIMRYVKYESADNQIVIRGYTTNDLINQRIIYRTENISTVVDEERTTVESGMYKIVNNQVLDIPYMETASAKGFSETFTTQFTGTNVLDAMIILGTQSGLGFYTEFDHKNKNHIFTVFKGFDRREGQRMNRPAKFSAELKNLANVKIVNDISIFRNVAYVAGGGEGEDRTWIVVNDNEHSGYDRYELFVDARDLQRDSDPESENFQTQAEYEQLLIGRGIEKLNEHIKTETFVAEIEPRGWEEDYYLGDIVSCRSDRYGIRIDTRILGYTEVRENGITTLSLTMGNPEITALNKIKVLIG